MKKFFIFLSLLATLCVSQTRPVTVRHEVPARYIYRTIDSHGTVEFWQHKPVLRTVNNQLVPSWHSSVTGPGSERIRVRNCVIIKQWRTSLRRIR